MEQISRGRPSKNQKEGKFEQINIRLSVEEKKAFKDSSKISGVPLSTWIRERLRQAAIRDLESVGHPIAFFDKMNWG